MIHYTPREVQYLYLNNSFIITDHVRCYNSKPHIVLIAFMLQSNRNKLTQMHHSTHSKNDVLSLIGMEF